MPPDAMATPPRTGTQAIERALALLSVLEESTADAVTLTELATKTGLSPSTAHRIARALVDAELLRQDPRTERYGFGRRLITLGQRAAHAFGLAAVQGMLEDLAEATGESVNLGVRDGDDVLVLVCVPSSQRLRFDQEAGARIPAYASAMGKALLAHDHDLDEVVKHLPRLAKLTGSTITSRATLRADLDQVRERGWALNDEEREAGVRTVAAPVLDERGTAVAAIAVQGPSVRMTDDRLPVIAARIRALAPEVSSRLIL